MFAIPYVCNLVFTIISGHTADRIRAKGLLSTTATRRWQTIIGRINKTIEIDLKCSSGACGTSIFLVLVGVIGCNHILAVVFISLSVAFIGFQASGSLISHLDIASNYAGTLVGITNMLAAIPGFVGPMFVGWMTNNNVSKSWTGSLDLPPVSLSLSFSKRSMPGDGFSTFQPVWPCSGVSSIVSFSMEKNSPGTVMMISNSEVNWSEFLIFIEYKNHIDESALQ